MPMAQHTRRVLVWGWLLAIVMAAPLSAQDPITTGNLDIDTADLEIMLRPLTADDLIIEADAWRNVVKTRATAVGAAEITARSATGDAKTQAQTAAANAKTAQDAVVERFQVVVDALKAKGGDVAAYEAYLAAVSGGLLDVSPEDAGALLTQAMEWLKSADGGIKWARNIVFFILILIAFRIVAGFIAGLVRRAVNASKLDVSEILEDFFVGSVRKVIFFVGLIIALSIIGVEIGPFLAAMGVLGFVIGFALQDTLGNFAAGLMILLYRPYDIGNVISAAGVTGKVDSMSLVSTTLKTPDNQNVVVPNGSIWGGVITNVTGSSTRRVDFVFGIGYDDDIAKAEKVLADIISGHDKILKDPAPVIQVHELADSSVNFVVRPWVKTGDYWDVYWDVTRAVKERFDAESISIPYPQQDVHMHQVS